MGFEENDTTDVAQLVIRYSRDTSYRYLLAKRGEDGYWEFIGGKRKEHETIQEAAIREFDEELAGIDSESVEIERIAESYPSAVSDRFSLYPVLMELPTKQALQIDEMNLSIEHDAVKWIEVSEFESFETLGQRPALERLSII